MDMEVLKRMKTKWDGWVLRGVACAAILLLCCGYGTAGDSKDDDVEQGLRTLKSAEAMAHVKYLASDDLEGREAGSAGGHLAGLYIANQFEKDGLLPGGSDDGYFQAFADSAEQGSLTFGDIRLSNYLTVFKDDGKSKAVEFQLGEEFTPVKSSKAAASTGRLVFAGYGISAPEYSYDDYQGLDAKNNIVIVFDHEPQEKDAKSAFNGNKPTKYSEWEHKAANAASKGAVALVILLDPLNHAEKKLPAQDGLVWPTAGKQGADYPIPVCYIGVEAAESIFKLCSKKPSELQKTIDQSLKPAGFALGRKGEISVRKHGPVQKGMKNIVAWKPGNDQSLKDECVVIGAHYDHVGYGNFGSRGTKGKIHNGADDNASGISALLEIAEGMKDVHLKRSVVFVAFDGEEKGLWGSKYYVNHPLLPMVKTIGMLNMDMIGRNDIKVLNIGMTDEENTLMKEVLLKVEQRFNVKLDRHGADEVITRSDQWNFHLKGVPGLFFFAGLHDDYHTEEDDTPKINSKKIELISKLVFYTMHRLANK